MRDRSTSLDRRRRPKQSRSRFTVQAIVEAAARVFLREGWSATTNRIAEAAGVSIGSLYEYFPNKDALLLALAEKHVEVAEAGIHAALAAETSTPELVAALQRAILESHRFPSQALELIEDVPRVGPELRARAAQLQRRVLTELESRARRAGLDEPTLRARAAFEVIGPLSVRTLYEEPEVLEALAPHYLAMALERLVTQAAR